jgi:signal transduction histidine kinase
VAPGGVLLLLYFASFLALEERWLRDAAPSSLRLLHVGRGAAAAVVFGVYTFVGVRRLRADWDAAMIRDLTAAERAFRARTQELEQAQAFTELLFDSLRERILVLDNGGVVVKANRVALLAAEGKPLVGERCRRVFTACHEHGGCPSLPQPPAGAPSDMSTTFVRGDAEGRLWEIERVPVPAIEGRRGLWLEVARDITQQKSLEAQVIHQEKMAGLGLLTAGFAHDLGNPLASLSSELELLEGETDRGEVERSLAVVRGHVGRIDRTLREMVDFARRRRDALSVVGVANVVADTSRLVRHDPRWRHIDLAVDLPADLPGVLVIEDHLVLVLLNLMLNAADAMPRGGALRVSARSDGARVVIALDDDGIGMSADVLGQALLPLFTTKAGTSGTGLGLSVSNDVIRAAGGTLRLQSEPGRGTTVEIELPAASDRLDEPASGEPSS